MPYLRKGELMPVKGIDFSVPASYLPDSQHFPKNVRLYRGELRKREGRSYMGNVMIGAQPVLHLANFKMSDSSNSLIRIGYRNVERYNPASGLWMDITGLDLTGTNNDFFSSAVDPADDYFIFTNYIDRPRKYTATGAPTVSLGGTTTFKAKFVEYVQPYVVFGGLIELGSSQLNKIRWSDTGDPENYTTGNSGSQLFLDEPTLIRGMKKLQDMLMVYKEGSVYRGRKVASASVFDFGGPFSMGKGLMSARAIADIGQAHIYMGADEDFHINDGVRITDIGSPIREYVFNRINRDRFNTFHAIHVEQYKEVWFFLTIGSETYPTEIWKYRYDIGFWYMDSIVNCITAAGDYKLTADLCWDDIPPAWDTQFWAWDDRGGLAAAFVPVFGFDTGFVHKSDQLTSNDIGSPFDGILETKDYTGLTASQEIADDVRWLQMDIWATGTALRLSYSTDEGGSWTFVEEKELTNSNRKYTYWFDVLSPKIRFRFENGNDEGSFTLRSFQPYYIAREEEIYSNAT